MPVRAKSSTSAIERIWSMVSLSWRALTSSTRRSMRAGLPGLVRTRASLTLMRWSERRVRMSLSTPTRSSTSMRSCTG